MADQPAGWYPDPRGEATQRYWDGSAWTDHIDGPPPSARVDGPAPGGFPPPPPGSSAAPPPPTGGGYAYAAQVYPRKSQAGLALGLSIVSLVVCGPLAIAGILMGRSEIQAIDRGEADPVKRGLAQAAFYIGIAAAVLWVIGILLLMSVNG